MLLIHLAAWKKNPVSGKFRNEEIDLFRFDVSNQYIISACTLLNNIVWDAHPSNNAHFIIVTVTNAIIKQDTIVITNVNTKTKEDQKTHF